MVRGPVSMVIVGIVMLFMFGLVALGPGAFEKFLPSQAVAWLETMGDAQMMADRGFSTKGEAGKGPDQYLRDGSDGWVAEGPIAGLAGGDAAFVDDVISGYSARIRKAETGSLTVVEPLQGCQPTPPSADAAFAHIGIRGDTGMDLQLWSYGDADLAYAVQVFVNMYRSKGIVMRPSVGGMAYESFDVAVTETARPVYLVVEAQLGRRIVNLHLAPGARLERVVLLGGEQMGVAHLPPGVPVEVMRATEMADCGANPFYPLNPGHLFWQSVANGAVRADEVDGHKARQKAAADAWEGWFQAAFGQGAGKTLAGGWRDATLGVAGPLPATAEARAVWASVDGADLVLTQDRYLETPAMARDGTGFAARVQAIATAFAWGDLGNLSLESLGPDTQSIDGGM